MALEKYKEKRDFSRTPEPEGGEAGSASGPLRFVVQKIYLDYLQNRWGQTMAAPYSIRPRAGAPVSTPWHWEEVKPGLDPKGFTIKNVLKRVEKHGDLWEAVLGPGIDMRVTLKLLKEVWEDLLRSVQDGRLPHHD